MKRAALPALAASLLAAAAAQAEGLWAAKGGGHELLKAGQAFHLVSAERQGASLKVDWDIAPGYYLYRKRLAFQVVAPDDARLQPPQLPGGDLVEDEQGKSEVYRNSLQAALRWSAARRRGSCGCSSRAAPKPASATRRRAS
jgi:thiol:disulfide interchange protein DsbD